MFLEKSAAEAFEDAKCEVVARAKRENGDAAPLPENLKSLIQVIEQGGAANIKLGKAAEIAIAKTKCVLLLLLFGMDTRGAECVCARP